MANVVKKVFKFYYDGFRGLTPTSRKLWLIIGIKLFIMFAVLKAFFFPNFLKQEAGKSKEAQSEYVGEQLIDRMSNPSNK